MARDSHTIAVRIDVEHYQLLLDALESSDHKRMSDLLRAIIGDWCQGWVNGE